MWQYQIKQLTPENSQVKKGQLLVSHGYTRLRLGDIMTLVGSEKSLEDLKFNGTTLNS